ncbi:GNAT family protein [Cereibacter sphaeroides f. sp. denitrificans]
MGIRPGAMPPETIALGVIDEWGELHAVICLNAFYSHYCSMHIASNGRRAWATRPVLRAIFGYAFEFLGLGRVNALVSARNIAVQVMALKLGFRFCGFLPDGADDGGDGILFGMLREQCPWWEGTV